MRDVVIIGGGLSGLAAALELQANHRPYTLIEVKPRLGGSIETVEHGGFLFDSGPMAYPVSNPARLEHYLAGLGLSDAAYLGANDKLVFRRGAGALIQAMTTRISAPLMMRMAVSTLGWLDESGSAFSICMENGMVLDARSLIVAAPARFAERLFYTLTPEISYHLLDYRYDTITRVSAGYRGQQNAALNLMYPQDSPVTETHRASNPERLPESQGAVMQAGLRFKPEELPADPVGELAALMRWPANPDADHIAHWPESDPAMWRTTDHPATIATIRGLMPDGVALAGSDYIATNLPPRLDERIDQGIAAARRVLAYLKQS